MHRRAMSLSSKAMMTKHGFDSRYQGRKLHGFAEARGCTERQRCLARGIVAREHDDRNLSKAGVCLQSRDHFGTAYERHHQIDQNELDVAFLTRQVETFVPVA